MKTQTTYRSLLKHSEIGPILGAVNFGRISAGLIPFGLVAFYSSRDEFAQAGIASAIVLIVGSMTAPLKGRVISFLSPKMTLMPMTIVYGICVVLSSWCTIAGLPFIVACLLLVVGTAVAAPTPSVVRALWTRLATDTRQVRAIHALDSVLEELTFALTPLITAAIWSTVGAFWSIVVGAICGIIGNGLILVIGLREGTRTRSLLSTPLADQKSDRRVLSFDIFRSIIVVYRSRSVAALLLPMIGLGYAMGSLTLALPAWSEGAGVSQSFSGILLSVISFVSCIVGLIFGRVQISRLTDVRQYQIAALFVAISVIMFSVSSSVGSGIAAAAILGLGMTPLFINAYIIVGTIGESKNYMELNASLGSSFNLGSGAAGALMGVLIGYLSVPVALLIAGIFVLLCSSCSLLFNRTNSATDGRDQA